MSPCSMPACSMPPCSTMPGAVPWSSILLCPSTQPKPGSCRQARSGQMRPRRKSQNFRVKHLHTHTRPAVLTYRDRAAETGKIREEGSLALLKRRQSPLWRPRRSTLSHARHAGSPPKSTRLSAEPAPAHACGVRSALRCNRGAVEGGVARAKITHTSLWSREGNPRPRIFSQRHGPASGPGGLSNATSVHA